MTALKQGLGMAARHGKLLLIAGLVAGILLPEVAIAMRPFLQELVAGLLFLAALRVGPGKAFGAVRDLPTRLGLALVLQLVLPVFAIGLFWMTGMLGNTLATALVLMLSASSISGSPNLTIMTGHDPAPALHLLVLGTAILPLTVIPVFWLLPELGGAAQVISASARLFAVIVVATIAAFAIRYYLIPEPNTDTLDGMSAIAMAVVVVGLMSSAGPTLFNTPMQFMGWLAVACAANFGLQISSALLLANTNMSRDLVPFSVIAGNRNIALFLVALPRDVTDPLLLFIGCYQIPMYLTPLVLHRFYAQW